jgi:hypothetical protein
MHQLGNAARQIDVEAGSKVLMKASRRFASKDEVHAVKYIRRMRGGSQACLLRCSDGARYVVKVQNNPQGKRILANELLGTLLATRLALPTATPAVVRVSKEFIQSNEEMVIQLARGREPMHSGSCFGSRFLRCEGSAPPTTDPLLAICSLLGNDQAHVIENITDVAGFLVFDKWTGNTDGRQTIAVQSSNLGYFKAVMIDQGFCFNGERWTFNDSPRLSTDLYNAVWKWIPSFSMFEIWFDRLNHMIDRPMLETLANEIPPEWYDDGRESLQRLLEQLDSRRNGVATLVFAAWKRIRADLSDRTPSRFRLAEPSPKDARRNRFADIDLA